MIHLEREQKYANWRANESVCYGVLKRKNERWIIAYD